MIAATVKNDSEEILENQESVFSYYFIATITTTTTTC